MLYISNYQQVTVMAYCYLFNFTYWHDSSGWRKEEKKMSKVSDSQRKAQKKYDEKNREKRTYLSQRSTSRGFIRNKATMEDLEELESLITARKKALAKN